VLDDGTVLAESNAILYYFADGTAYLPEKRIDRAQALRWMFFEQYRRSCPRTWCNCGPGGRADQNAAMRATSMF
jgi:glutathione S-transferase